jgi:hypothetical protein
MRRRVGGFTNGFPMVDSLLYQRVLGIWFVRYPLLWHGEAGFKNNWIEVTELGDRGKELSGWEKTYFIAHEIGEWVAKELYVKAEK